MRYEEKTAGEKIRELRKEKKLTQSKLSEQFLNYGCSVSKSQIGRVENDEAYLRSNELEAFSKIFFLSI